MAQFKKEFKDLFCSSHAGEQIICLSKDPAEKKLLYCVHCVLQADTASKNTMAPIATAIEEIYAGLFSKDRLIVEDSYLDSLLETLDTKNYVVGKLTEHIESEKERVTKEFENLTATVEKMVTSAKNKIFAQLDKQVDTLKVNYAFYRQKLKKYSSFDNGSRKVNSLDEFYHDLEKSGSSDIFEQVWRDLLDDLKDSNTLAVYGNKAQRVLADKLEEYKEMVKSGHKVYPKCLVGSGFHYNTIKDEFTRMLKSLLDRSCGLDSQILSHEDFMKSINITKSLDSHIIHGYDIPLLEKVSGGPIYNLSLEFRASKDNTDLNLAKKVFQESDDAMLLMKTMAGQIVGYRKSKVREGGMKNPKIVQRGIAFSLSDQVGRQEEEGGNQGVGILPGFMGGNAQSNNWPSKYLHVANPVTLQQEIAYMEIIPTLDEKGFYSKAFSPREVEVYRLL